MSADESVDFRHSPQLVERVVRVVSELADEDAPVYFRARDLPLDAPNTGIGTILSQVADRPDAVERCYGVGIPVEVERRAYRGDCTTWEVRES